MQYVITKPALQDEQEILRYLCEVNPRAADALLDKLYEKYSLITQMPLVGTVHQHSYDGDDFLVRWVMEGQYMIFYRVCASCVEILRVLHHARDIAALLH